MQNILNRIRSDINQKKISRPLLAGASDTLSEEGAGTNTAL